jgi:hypothetical protein
MYSGNALGVYLKNKADRDLNGFDFVVAQGGNWYGVNPIIRTITDKAKSANLPVIIEFDYDPGYYTQYVLNREDLLPPLKDDEMYQAFLNATSTTVVGNYHAISIRVNNQLDQYGKEVDPDWISWGAKMFIKRVESWRNKYKPNMWIILNTSGDYIKNFAIDMSIWVHNFEPYVIQKAALGSDSYPLATEKPRYYTPTWKFWEYYGFGVEQNSAKTFGLVVFNGNKDAFRTYMELDVQPEPEPEPDPEPEPNPDPIDLSNYVKKEELAALQAQVDHLATILDGFMDEYEDHTHNANVNVTVTKPV